MIAALTFSANRSLTVYANEDIMEENSIEIFRKDLITGEETLENVVVSNDENVLEAEGLQMDEIMPNAIIGEDETVPVPNSLMNNMPYSAIGRIRSTFDNGTVEEGTGFLFGPNDVATAAHVLFNKQGYIANRVTFWLPGSGGPVVTYEGTDLVIPTEYKNTFSINYDWGMFHINSNIGNTKGYLGWTQSVSVGTTVQVIGYASSQMMLAGKQIQEVTEHLIAYDVDTLKGQSGSPVLNRLAGNVMVGIHGGPLYLLNEGCRVTPVMATILNMYRNE